MIKTGRDTDRVRRVGEQSFIGRKTRGCELGKTLAFQSIRFAHNSGVASPVTAPPPYRHSSRIITEPDEFADAASGIDLRVDFQKRQERESSVEQFQSADWALDFGEQT